MSDVKWIKITTDIFDDEKIQLIEGLPDADTIIVIWFKLLCMSGKQNNGGVFIMNDRIAYTEEMLSTIFRRSIPQVQLAIQTFVNFGMIEIVDNVITIPNWNKYQSLDAYERKKERDREYQRKRREEQKKAIEKKESSDNRSTVGRNCSYSISSSSSISLKDKRKQKYKTEREEIIAYLNEKAGKSLRPDTDSYVELINGRLNDGYTVEDFKTVMDNKYDQWNGTPQMKFFRPSTLFAKSHFDEYLNDTIPSQKKDDSEDW